MRVRYRFAVIGYVVMPEHVHPLISEPWISDPSKIIQAVKLSVSRQRAIGDEFSGRFWQSRFYDFNLWGQQKEVGSAYSPRGAEAYVYRKTGVQRWEQSTSGLPAAKGTTVSRFATHAGEPDVIYAANNRGLFRSGDAGRSWKAMDLPWPGPGLADGVAALACLPE